MTPNYDITLSANVKKAGWHYDAIKTLATGKMIV